MKKIIFFFYISLFVGINGYSQTTLPETATYSELFFSTFIDYARYIWNEITFNTVPWYQNYFWLLVGLSLLIWGLEVAFPWRKNQARIRKDFWLDAFYMFFNFYLFKLIIFTAFSKVTEHVFQDLFGETLSSLVLIDLSTLHPVLQFVLFFLAIDFVQWFTHFLLHRFNFLWRFHKVHHSVLEMGFAAHLRYHWMENVFYTPVKYLALLFIGGFNYETAFLVYYISIAIGHLNHANINLSYGPLKYLLNNPKMHIWHHAHSLPEKHKFGANFGISLSIWDYLFRTNYIPSDGRDIRLGFENDDKFPKTFWGQLVYGFKKGKDE